MLINSHIVWSVVPLCCTAASDDRCCAQFEGVPARWRPSRSSASVSADQRPSFGTGGSGGGGGGGGGGISGGAIAGIVIGVLAGVALLAVAVWYLLRRRRRRRGDMEMARPKKGVEMPTSAVGQRNKGVPAGLSCACCSQASVIVTILSVHVTVHVTKETT